MASFNAAKARTKYALPLWVDAFVRDTLDLSADEIGAFNLILWAMWSRESCDLPDDDRKLARVARTSPQTWRRRVRPALEPLFKVREGAWTSVRLQREAVKTEKFLKSQSDRRNGVDQKYEVLPEHGGAQLDDKETGNFSDNTLKTNKPPLTVDVTTDTTRDRPTQETKRPSIGGGERAGARDQPYDPPQTDRERVLSAIGADPISGIVGPNGRQLGRLADMQELRAWQSDLGLSIDDVVDVIADTMARKSDGPPSTFAYFTQPMQRFAAQKARPTLTPIEGGQTNDRPGPTRNDPRARATESIIAGFGRALADKR